MTREGGRWKKRTTTFTRVDPFQDTQAFFGGGGSSTYRKGELEDGNRGCRDNNPDQLPRKESQAQQAASRVGDTMTKGDEQGESMGAGKGG